MAEIIFQLDEELMTQSLQDDTYKQNYDYYTNTDNTDYFNVYNGVDEMEMDQTYDDYNSNYNYLSPIPELSSSVDSVDSLIKLDRTIEPVMIDGVAGSNYQKWRMLTT